MPQACPVEAHASCYTYGAPTPKSLRTIAAAKPPRSSGAEWIWCGSLGSEKPNDLQGKPGGFSMLSYCAVKNVAGTVSLRQHHTASATGHRRWPMRPKRCLWIAIFTAQRFPSLTVVLRWLRGRWLFGRPTLGMMKLAGASSAVDPLAASMMEQAIAHGRRSRRR